MLAVAKKNWATIAGSGAIAAVLLLSASWIGNTTINALVESAATERTTNFVEFLENDRVYLDGLQTGITRDPDLETMLRAASSISGILGFTLFDSSGTHIFSTRARQDDWQLRNRPGGLSDGGRLILPPDGRDPDWSVVRNAAFDVPTAIMPIERNQALAFYVAADIDLSQERADFEHALKLAMLALVLVLSVATGVPVLFYVRRKRRVEEADERIFFLHNHDPLTNLLNRRRMQEETERVLATSRATRERAAIWYLDVDRLAEINDRLGQSGGDAVLRAIADRLAEVVDQSDLVSRIGSDDFAILQRAYSGEESLISLANQILAALHAPIEVNGETITPSISLGVALMPDHGRTYAELIKHAEHAFTYQKNVRQKDYTVFEPEMDKETHRRWMIEQGLRSALADDSFALFYQPIVSGSGGEVIGFEALLRMPDGKGGYIPPIEFIPIAESRGYIKALGTWVIREATRQAALWPDDLFISVNLSAVQFRDGDIVTIVRQALDDAGIEGKRLGIEVVENLLLDHSDEVLEQLRGLKRLGVSIDMDDFGTGYSSLGYLWRFPFDKLKIDQSFMVACAQGQSSVTQILETIIALAHNLGLKVTAEGIETAEQAALLSGFGCDQLQGFYFGKPMPPERIAAEILSSFAARKLPRSARIPLAAPAKATQALDQTSTRSTFSRHGK